ncbi:hypothetical protein F4824DRAFT_448359 [Ustulina deusta]|nr:hypothetical protein F4824DRAFT_448359 [Ustulina deusta]
MRSVINGIAWREIYILHLLLYVCNSFDASLGLPLEFKRCRFQRVISHSQAMSVLGNVRLQWAELNSLPISCVSLETAATMFIPSR